MINIVIEDAEVYERAGFNFSKAGWGVKHPSNDAILAYCETKEEAIAVREGINDLARQLRGIGHKVT